jgi:hypothetical protein
VSEMSSHHLDADVIAEIVDGMNPDSHPEAIAHLSECSDCRARLIAVANLLDDPLVAAEIKNLDAQTTRRRPAAYWTAGATLAAAAAITIIFVGPNKLNRRADEPVASSETRREATVTTTAPPRILSPSAIGTNDSLRWTSVPGADLYRVQVWDREGNVKVSQDTRDTVLALPSQITRAGGSYLWEVKARTGWDRWVSSDFLEMNVKLHAP